MDTSVQNNDPVLESALNLLEILSLFGLVYCLLIVLHTMVIEPQWHLLVYAGWFAASVVCVYAMLRCKTWGAYGLAAATLLVTIIDIVGGRATLGGATLGLLVGVILYAYLRPTWCNLESALLRDLGIDD